MARKSKVEASPHFQEIVNLLLQGKSGRQISTYLKEKYGENIGFNAINVYRRNHINMEKRVEAELNKRADEKRKQKKKDDSLTEEAVQKQADIQESVNDTISSVAETIANNMEGVAKVAAQFPEKFEEACSDAENEESPVTSKDVARLALDANKLYNDYFKNEETNVEININEGFGELADAISKSRKALED